MAHHYPSPLTNSRGGFLVLGAIFIALLFGFAALGIEAGRWFAIKAEMAKAVDAASLAGATHMTNPLINTSQQDREQFIRRMAQANFHKGLLGTDQYTTFTVITDDHTNKVSINGQANALNTVSRALFYASDSVPVDAFGAAKLGGAEILLVTDVSGSMSRPESDPPIDDLKSAAQQFIDNFEDIQSQVLMGLVSYADGAVVDYELQTDFHINLSTKINALVANNGGTNTAEGLAKARINGGFTPYTTEPPEDRRDQYVIFISDGQPTAFTAGFRHNGTLHNRAVIQSYTSSPHDLVQDALYDPDLREAAYLGGSITPLWRGDGEPIATSNCGRETTKWLILEDLTYGPSTATNFYAPLSGGGSEDCMEDPAESATGGYIIQTAEKMALAEVTLLDAENIKIYAIGFGTINTTFLSQVASGPEYYFPAASSAQLAGILQIIADRLKLRLLE